MLKGTKPGTGPSSLPFPDRPHRCSSAASSGQLKSKLNLLTATSVLQQQGGARAAPRPPEALSSLANGSVPRLSTAEEEEEEEEEPRANVNMKVAADCSPSGQLQLRHRGMGQSRIYSVSEEVSERRDGDESSKNRDASGDREGDGGRDAMETARPSSGKKKDERKDSQKDGEQKEAEDSNK